MKKQYFLFSDETKKIRSKFLVLSGVSLFVGLTETLPKKFSLLGLDLSNNQEVLGWFILFVTFILFFNFIAVAILEFIEYYLPSLIKKKTDKTTGATLGLTLEECIRPQDGNDVQYENIGTSAQELDDINIANTIITYNYKKLYVRFHDINVFLFEFISPVIFSFFGMYYLYSYLSCLK